MILENAEDHRCALFLVSEMLTNIYKPSIEGITLEVLVAAVVAYEDIHYPMGYDIEKENVMLTRTELKEQLQAGNYNVTFTKTDGTKRIMHCTLQEDALPKRTDTTEKVERKVNESILSVWDLEKAGWRSFRMDAITEIDKVI